MDREDDGVARDAFDGADADRAAMHPTSVEALASAAIARLAAENSRRALEVPLSESEIDAFCALLLGADYAKAEAWMRRLTERRQDYAQISDGILAQTARRLGRRWEEDGLSFAEVSVGITQIFRLNQAFRQRNVPLTRADDRLALFATLPGQPHNLGLVLAAEAFRGEGWQVDLRLDATAREIVERAQRLRPALIGLTISREDRRHQLAHLIATLRGLPVPFRIMLGGRGATDMVRILPPGHVDRVVTDIAGALREA